MDKRNIKQELTRTGRELREKWRKLKRKDKIMLAGAGLFLLAGFCILFAPKTAKQQRLREQEELTTILLAGEEDVMEIVAASEAETLVFYDSDAEELDYFGDPPPKTGTAVEETESKFRTAEVVGLGILEIDKINLRLPVAEGTTKHTLKVAAGHISETAVIGQGGNAVVAAHRSYTKGELFNRLDELAVGDTVTYRAKSGAAHRFEVIDVQVLEPSDSSVFDIREGCADLTLYTWGLSRNLCTSVNFR